MFLGKVYIAYNISVFTRVGGDYIVEIKWSQQRQTKQAERDIPVYQCYDCTFQHCETLLDIFSNSRRVAIRSVRMSFWRWQCHRTQLQIDEHELNKCKSIYLIQSSCLWRRVTWLALRRRLNWVRRFVANCAKITVALWTVAVVYSCNTTICKHCLGKIAASPLDRFKDSIPKLQHS